MNKPVARAVMALILSIPAQEFGNPGYHLDHAELVCPELLDIFIHDSARPVMQG
ncbi:hypothetical protein GJ744_008498 [Endocarpon pusillum]|uniref:Uncharacterized protein n=1 Tax=Endocarpon pusillum TaxID=364733 RepID=A0A8H7AL31_9EURO|nr:hypothetical protein GJ744_008498 [Endocarpon pusillum]